MSVGIGGAAAPPRPRGLQGRLAFFFLHAFAPRVPRVPPVDPPAHFAPFERFDVSRPDGGDPLHATWYPSTGPARGAVLLAHPWLRHGQAYFHRYGRIPALRAAGYHALTFDLPGFGGSGRARGFWDREIESMFDVLARRAPGLPWHYWGVSSGGVWGHVLLARRDGITGVGLGRVHGMPRVGRPGRGRTRHPWFSPGRVPLAIPSITAAAVRYASRAAKPLDWLETYLNKSDIN